MVSWSNCRIHLTRWAVKAPAEKHGRPERRDGGQGVRRAQAAGAF